MKKTATNLKRILEYLDITNVVLARAINVDASLISRWLNGQRQLKFSSDILNSLTEYLMDKVLRTKNENWLQRQMELDGLTFDYTSSGDLQKGLKIWLSSDGDDVSKTLDLHPAITNIKADNSENHVKTGYVEISVFLEKTLASLPSGTQIDIHLSNEDTGILLHESISRILFNSMIKSHFQIRLLISLASDTMAMSRLLSRYIQAIIEGFLTVSVVHGMTQAITNQATFIFGKETVFIVCETPKSIAPPIGTATWEESFIKESQKSFERAYNYSQALLQRYDDNYSRNVLEILYQEFALPGNLDIIKDSINPMYMTMETYDRFLKTFGHKGEQFKWRSAEFVRFKTGMDENLNNGTIFREVLSLSRLKKIAAEGKCKMPALYYMNTGVVYLDAAGCLSIIEGYIDYLKRVPNFNIIILEGMTELNENNCWQLKQNSHVAINGWSKEEHIILYTNQLMLTHEFQVYFNNLWDKEHDSEGRRKKTIQTLQEIADELKANHNLS